MASGTRMNPASWEAGEGGGGNRGRGFGRNGMGKRGGE